jgi:hypothetical protein
MWWVKSHGIDHSYLANIFILTKMQVSSVYHNHSRLLNFGASLQLLKLLAEQVRPQHVDMKKAEPFLTPPFMFAS